MHFLDRESVLLCAVIALMIGIGTVAGISGLLGVNIMEYGFITVAGFVLGIAGLIWGVLLLWNLKH